MLFLMQIQYCHRFKLIEFLYQNEATKLIRVCGNATFNEITAKSLTLIGDNGKQIMSMGSGEDGPGFVLFDEDLTPRVALGINTKDKSVGIAFLDKKSNARIAIGTAESGDAGISLLGAGISAPLVGKVWPSQ